MNNTVGLSVDICPNCGAATRVCNSRIIKGVRQRRRVCQKCGHRFTSLEISIDAYQECLADMIFKTLASKSPNKK